MEVTAATYALISMITTGFAIAFSKKPTEHVNPTKLIFYRNIIVVFSLTLIYPLFRETPMINLNFISQAILLSSFSYFGLYFFMKAVKNGKLGVVTPIASSSVFIAILTGAFLLNDTINKYQIGAATIILVGVVLISVNIKAFRNSDLFNKESGVPYALAAALIWGITSPLFSIPAKNLGAGFYTLILETTVLVAAFITLKVQKIRIPLNPKERALIPAIVSFGFFGMLGSAFQNLAYATKEVILTSTIISGWQAIPLIYGRIVFGEKLSRLRYVGIVLVFLGVITMAYFKNSS